jgi:single-stranded-DNA-specific exonuclease
VSHGSARSIPGFDIAKALSSAVDLLIRSGGHGQAAGLAIRNENLPRLQDQLAAEIERLGLSVPLTAMAEIDADLEPDQVTMETAEAIALLEPFGNGNEAPLFRIRGITVRQWDTVGQDKRHLRFQFGAGTCGFKAVGFGMADRSREFILNRQVDILARLKIDHWNGQRRLDVHVQDFRPAS